MRARLRHGVRSSATLAAVALLAPLGMVGQPSAGAAGTTTSDPCALSEILVNPCRPLLGAESNGYLPGATFPARMKEHETRIGRNVDMVHIYVTDKPTMTAYEKQSASDPDRIPLVNWKVSSDWAAAADGSLDDKIDVMADDLKSIPRKVMFAVAHEPEDNVTPDGDPSCQASKTTDLRGTATDYVNMWHRVRERFDAKGVDNVVWVMNYMGYQSYFGCAEVLWPGNDYVDWVMWDPYPNTQDFETTVGGFYDHLISASDADHDFLAKPWGLAEWGYMGSDQDNAYAMYDDAWQALHDNTFPRLKAYVIWDNVGGKDERVGYDSAGLPDAEEQSAYNRFANDPTFSPDHTPPIPPGALEADSVTGTSAHLSWTPSSDQVRVAGYRLRRDHALVATLPATARDYTDPALDDAHAYGYEVVAFDPSGNESDPTLMTVNTPDETAPTTPTSLVATPGKGQVSLSWTPSEDNVAVTGYQVWRSGTLRGTTSDTSYTDTGLGELTSYSWSLVAVDAAGNASGPVTRSARTLDATAPKAPTSLKASLSGTSVRLTWTRPTDNVGVTSYAVYRGGTLVGTPTTTAFADATAPQGTRASYTVRALDAARNTSAARRPSP